MRLLGGAMNASWQINYDREEGLEAWLIGEAGLVLAKGARGKEKKWILNNPQRKFSRHI